MLQSSPHGLPYNKPHQTARCPSPPRRAIARSVPRDQPALTAAIPHCPRKSQLATSRPPRRESYQATLALRVSHSPARCLAPARAPCKSLSIQYPVVSPLSSVCSLPEVTIRIAQSQKASFTPPTITCRGDRRAAPDCRRGGRSRAPPYLPLPRASTLVLSTQVQPCSLQSDLSSKLRRTFARMHFLSPLPGRRTQTSARGHTTSQRSGFAVVHCAVRLDRHVADF
jgi:hypothetical protein